MLATNTIEFSLEGREYIELNNLLKITGLCSSGGEAKVLIASSQVRVDGQVELRKRCKLRPDQRIDFNDTQIIIRP